MKLDRSVVDRLNANADRKHIPWSRNRRIRKKQEKAHRHSAQFIAAMAVKPLFSRPPWKCDVCGKTEGHYAALGRSLIQIEPLSPP
jgi:hypothetical protein